MHLDFTNDLLFNVLYNFPTRNQIILNVNLLANFPKNFPKLLISISRGRFTGDVATIFPDE